MFSSFRAKLVLWYGLIVLLTLILFRAISLQSVQTSLYDDLDRSLQNEVRWVHSTVKLLKLREYSEEAIFEEIDDRTRLSGRKEIIQVNDVRGRPLFRSNNLEEAHAIPLLDERSPSGGPALTEPVTATEYRPYAIRLYGIKDSSYVIYVGYSVTDIEAAIDTFVSSFILFIPLTLVLIITGGLFLSSRFMRPLKNLNAYADDLGELPLDRDIPDPTVPSNDELGLLTRRITGLIKSMRKTMRQSLGFTSLASHELRTPLTIIRNRLEFSMRENTPRDELTRTLTATYDEILRMGRAVDDLLSLGTMQAGTFYLERTPVSVRTFLQEFYEDAPLFCKDKGLTMTMDPAPDIEVMIDETRMRQVLFNLLHNAIKFTPTGGSIRFSAYDDHGLVHLRLSDTGEGIPPDEIPFIFDVFHRASPHSKHAQGTGLGLSLVKWIVEAHQGSIHVDSAVNKGSTFTISLPLHRPAC